jgi:hypothetical protein
MATDRMQAAAPAMAAPVAVEQPPLAIEAPTPPLAEAQPPVLVVAAPPLVVSVALPPEAAALPVVPAITSEPLAAPPLAVDLPDAPRRATPAGSVPAIAAQVQPITKEPRPVDIAQISESEVVSLRIPQLHESGLAAASSPTLADRIASMQVSPPPPVRLRESERAVLLAEGPSQLTVRLGKAAVGKVDFRMTDTHTIAVKLGGLLDLLADRYDAADFARLRHSAAADAYVGFDQLRTLGLNLRYDPVYDELRIAG